MHAYFQGTVGERIQDLLREKKLTQAVLAERVGISKATLSRYITDPDSRIPHDALLKITKCFGVSTDFLLGVTDTANLLQKQGKTNPRDKTAARLALKDLRSHMIPPMLPDMVMIRAAFEALLTDLMRQADAHVKEQTKLTGDIMENMIRHLERRQNSFDLKKITIDDLADAIVETVNEAGYPADQREKLREQLTVMFRNVAQGTA